MESQFDPRLLLLVEGKGSKLFKASILPASDVSCAFLSCAMKVPQVFFLQQCCFSFCPSGQTDHVSPGPDIDIDAETGNVGVYTCGFFTYAHTCTHVSGDCLRKQNSDQKSRLRETKCTRLAWMMDEGIRQTKTAMIGLINRL